MATNITRVVTSGTFELDGGSWDVDNNVWVVGDDGDVVVLDGAHTASPIIKAVAGRNVVAVVCTHGHRDHLTVAPDLCKTLDASVLLRPADGMLWRMTHPGKDFCGVEDGRHRTVVLRLPDHFGVHLRTTRHAIRTDRRLHRPRRHPRRRRNRPLRRIGRARALEMRVPGTENSAYGSTSGRTGAGGSCVPRG